MTTAPPNGQARRRARTRTALENAARQLLIEGRSNASIDEITKRAGVGFGSFYNHAASKEELFAGVLQHDFERYAARLHAAIGEVGDPAVRFATGLRLTGRMAIAEPDPFALIIRSSPRQFSDRGLRAAAHDVVRAGVAEGRFVRIAPERLLNALSGILQAALQQILEAPGEFTDEDMDAVVVDVLRLFGLDEDEARRIVTLPLPETPTLMP